MFELLPSVHSNKCYPVSFFQNAFSSLLPLCNASHNPTCQMREEEVSQMRQEIAKQTKMREVMQKKFHQMEEQKADVDVQRETLKAQIAGLEKGKETRLVYHRHTRCSVLIRNAFPS